VHSAPKCAIWIYTDVELDTVFVSSWGMAMPTAAGKLVTTPRFGRQQPQHNPHVDALSHHGAAGSGATPKQRRHLLHDSRLNVCTLIGCMY
jgi:hypothetical protein